MEVRATAKYLRVQPRKVRIIADEIRGMDATMAAHKLRYHTSKSAKLLRKVLINAMANAVENNQLSPETLRISTIEVNEGPRIKRIQARAMGRANRIVKKTSHITVVVEDVEPKTAVKPHGTKSKPRPKFAAPAAPKAKKAEKVAEEIQEPVEVATEEVVTEAPVQEEVKASEETQEN